MQKTQTIPHNVIMEDRKSLRISGVKDIDSFTETRIVLDTVLGELVIKGEELHVLSLDAGTGDFSMKGTVSSLTYSRGSVFDNPVTKLFK
ncbi:MAG: sporulation protein YabP [Oscillospiraceae bacterium]